MEKRDRERMAAINDEITALEGQIARIRQQDVSLMARADTTSEWQPVSEFWGIPEHILQTKLRETAVAMKQAEIDTLDAELDGMMSGKVISLASGHSLVPAARLMPKVTMAEDAPADGAAQ